MMRLQAGKPQVGGSPASFCRCTLVNSCTASLEKTDNFRKIGGRPVAMRLVKDDDVTLMEQQDDLQQQQADTEVDPQEQRLSNPPEQPDGVVEDSADEKDESSSESADVQVDLRTLEALLFSTHHPLTAGRLAELLELESTKPIRRAIKELNEQYVDSDRSFRIEQVAGGYQLLTVPEFGDILKKLHQREVDAKLTKAALETLAIIAYKQPILRADIEAIRGVACGETIRSLMEKHLVKIAGRAEIPGRPILYGTTKRFLELFGLNSLKDLPQGENQLRPTA
jgi:segregation and condensation protein B